MDFAGTSSLELGLWFGFAPILLRKTVSFPIWLMVQARKSQMALAVLPYLPVSVQRYTARKGLLPLLVPMETLETTFRSALELVPGVASGGQITYLEFGVNQGSSMVCMYRAANRLNLAYRMRFVGFDSFEGLPPETETIADQGGDAWHTGDFASPLSFTKAYLETHGVPEGSVQLVKGWFKDTLSPAAATELRLTKVDVIMIDCDLYSATVEVLAFCEPLIVDRAIVVFDDWGDESTPDNVGEEKAFGEFLGAHPEFQATGLPNLKYQCYANVFELVRTTAR